jgi:hypothetical protein
MNFLALLMPLLASGARGVLEDPAYLMGVPLLVLGIVGALIALSPVGVARPPKTAKRPGTSPDEKSRPDAQVTAEAVTAVPLSIWPVVMAAGMFVFGLGIVLHFSLIIAGGLIAVLAFGMWLVETRGNSS